MRKLLLEELLPTCHWSGSYLGYWVWWSNCAPMINACVYDSSISVWEWGWLFMNKAFRSQGCLRLCHLYILQWAYSCTVLSGLPLFIPSSLTSLVYAQFPFSADVACAFKVMSVATGVLLLRWCDDTAQLQEGWSKVSLIRFSISCVFSWICTKSLQRHTLVTYTCHCALNAAISYVITQSLLCPENDIFGCWALVFCIFLCKVVQFTLRGKSKSSFPAYSDGSLGFNTSPNSKHIFLLLQFFASVMTVFLCCDADLRRAHEKRNSEEGNGGKLLSILKKGCSEDWKRRLKQGNDRS